MPASGWANRARCKAKAKRRVGQQLGDHAPQHPFAERAAIIVLDVSARDIDQVRIINLDRARGHAGQARQAAVEMVDCLGVRHSALLQHRANKIDAPARRVVLITEQHVGRTGRCAEAVMDAGFQDAVGLGNRRPRKLFERKSGLHVV